MSLREKCIVWYYNVFKQCQMFKAMESITEGSPWHREVNIGVHTDMVVAQYISRQPNTWTIVNVLGFLTCAFHDVGKPLSEIHKYSESRGNYKAYHGHEKVSSRMWEDYIMENKDIIEYFGLSYKNIYGITWMIEHHVPWATKDIKKLENYSKTVINIFGNINFGIFCDILLSDTFGRISDDSTEKIKSAIEWTNEFHIRTEQLILNPPKIEYIDNKVLYIPIAASGTGKSTYYKDLKNYSHNSQSLFDTNYYSLDKLRIDWYPGDTYNDSWAQSSEDKDFKNKANAEFMNMIKLDKSLYVDNCNLSKKSRNFYVMEARKRNYKIVGIVFPISVYDLISRQENRTDKVIGPEIYSNMYQSLQQPSFGEFDKIEVIL